MFLSHKKYKCMHRPVYVIAEKKATEGYALHCNGDLSKGD